MTKKSVYFVVLYLLTTAAYAAADGWSYFEVPHIRTGDYMPEASVISQNTLPLPAKTRDTNYGYITVRKNADRIEEVSLDVEQGRRLVCTPGSCSIAFIFDDRAPIWFQGGPSPDHGSTRIVIHDSKAFLSHVRQAKKISVRFQDADNGVATFDFVTPVPLRFPAKVKRLNG